MDETPRPNWFLRARGLVVQADLGVKPEEVKRYERVNALRKVGAGLPLTDTDKGALEATKGEPLHGLPAGIYRPDVTMGFVFHEAGDLVRQLDGIALELARRLGPAPDWANEMLAWATLRAYAQRAEENATQEAEFFNEIDLDEAAAGSVTLKDGTEIKVTATDPAVAEAQRLEVEAEERAFFESAAGIAQETPDDGPDGWSTIPPANPAHPLHPDNLPPHEGEV